MIRKSEPETVNWTAGGIQMFNKLKDILVLSPIMISPPLHFTNRRLGGWGSSCTQSKLMLKIMIIQWLISVENCLAIKLRVEAFQVY